MRDKLRYNAYSDYLKEKYGEKVYKIPINIDATCPNRDGRIGEGGCIFCGEMGAGFENLSNKLSVSKQLQDNIEYIGKKYGAKKFIAYFQNFTNTYISKEDLIEYSEAAASFDNVVELCYSTRPDCIPDSYLSIIDEIASKQGKYVTIELGLQTVNYHTLGKLNRGHSLAEFIDSALRINKHNFKICAHVILNLPWDDDNDAIETAKIISALNIDFVKIHSLYIEKNTKLGEMFQNAEFDIIKLDQYIDRAILFLEYLSNKVVVQRLVGRAPKEITLFCNWDTSWWKIKDAIEIKLEEKNTYQGAKCNYLGGIEYGK